MGLRLTVEENRETIKRYAHVKPVPFWGTRRCSAQCPGSSRTCTLEKGHRGPHIAHGLFRRVLAVWELRDDPRVSRAIASRMKKKPARPAPRPVLPDGGPVALLKAFWDRIRVYIPPIEEILLIALGLMMFWFAIDTALRILGWR